MSDLWLSCEICKGTGKSGRDLVLLRPIRCQDCDGTGIIPVLDGEEHYKDFSASREIDYGYD